MGNAKDVLTMLESLAIMAEDSAEIGNLDPAIYADVTKLMGILAATAKTLIGGDGDD